MAKNKKMDGRSIFFGFCKYYKPYMSILIADLICAIILAAIDLAFPQLLRFFTNDFFTRSSAEIINALFLIAVILIALYLVSSACDYYITR